MKLSESLFSSLQNIFTHKLRSALTLLGIIIGVFAVVTMFSSIYGLKNLINDRMEGMGWNNSIIIYPSEGFSENQSFRRRMRFRYIKREAKPLTLHDFEMLEKEVDSKYIYGMVEVYDRMLRNEKEHNVRMRATNIMFFTSKTYPLKSGRYFNRFEEINASKVCVIGFHFAEDHFKDEDPIGQILTIGANRFKIIGVLDDDVLNQAGMNFNNWERWQDLKSIYIPLSTGSRYLRAGNAIDYIYLQAENTEKFKRMKTVTRQNLLAEHKMAHDFSFNDVGAMMFKITEELNEMMKKWNVTLSAIASISLIVGGIGLFSTLLISINERMTEIGIRKSIGATNTDIFLHFILEAVILALIAALIGIFASTFVVQIISKALKSTFPTPIEGILLGIGFSVLIGIFSGLYPAIKASKIDPIKAIFYFE
ncbi:MAG TPA: ABC transporter permease [Candidatus Cloacimonetes bacterium]|nr:ABC transporter permease [Candidatus Cloacimonadota bacterium]